MRHALSGYALDCGEDFADGMAVAGSEIGCERLAMGEVFEAGDVSFG